MNSKLFNFVSVAGCFRGKINIRWTTCHSVHRHRNYGHFVCGPFVYKTKANPGDKSLNKMSVSIMTQHNASQHNDSQHNGSQHNDSQHNDSQHNDSQHNDSQHKAAVEGILRPPFIAIQNVAS